MLPHEVKFLERYYVRVKKEPVKGETECRGLTRPAVDEKEETSIGAQAVR